MILEISHRTSYTYGHPVSVSHHRLHLTPRATATQTCLASRIAIDPQPSGWLDEIDHFGNARSFVTIDTAHDDLTITATSRVEVRAPRLAAPDASAPFEEVETTLERARTRAALEAAEFAFPSVHVPRSAELRAYALPSFVRGRPIAQAAIDLSRRIHREFRYDPNATTLATPVSEALAMRRGVCQDFAHVGIGCLRSMGLAARYVSGYLLTHPPEGRERLTGADASHAWLSVWTGDAGWLDLDPTNDLVPGEEHVTLAWGRDYADVSPVSGVMFGGGDHSLSVAVDVAPAGD